KTTATVRKINAGFGSLTRPIGDIRNSVGALGREAGIDRIGKSMMGVGQAAAGVAQSVAKIAAPMAAIFRLGGVATVAATTLAWARLGAEVGRTSAIIGVSTTQLQGLRGAAQLAGLSAESMTAGLKSLGNTMEDAMFGRNQEALVMMQRLGISLHHTA